MILYDFAEFLFLTFAHNDTENGILCIIIFNFFKI